MGKLTLKDNLSPETREKLLKLKGETMPLQNDKSGLMKKQGRSPNVDKEIPSSQQSSSQKEKGAFGIKKISPQEKRDKEKAKGLFYETKAWLESTFPKAINFKDPKPLKIGISDLLLASTCPYSKRQLRKCFGSYCASRAYLEAIIQGDWRYDLNGVQAEGITQEHKDYAAKQLEIRKNKFKNRQTHPDKGKNTGGEEAQQGEDSCG